MAHGFLIHSVAPASRLAAGLAVVVLALSAGCGRSDTGTGRSGEKIAAKQQGESVNATLKDKQGKEDRVATGEMGVTVPDFFPRDIAVYPGAVCDGWGGSRSVLVAFKTANPVERVIAFYSKRLDESGWKGEVSVGAKRGWEFKGWKNGRYLAVEILGRPGFTGIAFTVDSSRRPGADSNASTPAGN